MLPLISMVPSAGFSGATPPPPFSLTVTLPVIEECISQWYIKVPDPEKVTMKKSPGFNVFESNDPSSAVTVCGAAPSLTH